MTRTSDDLSTRGFTSTGAAGERAPEGLHGEPMRDPLHHAPKPASVGLGADGRAAVSETGDAAGVYEDRAGLGDGRGGPYRPAAGNTAADQRSIADLIKELRDEATHLLRQEVNLAKTELGEKASFFGAQAGKVAAGGAVLGVGALMLLTALACFVAWVFAAAWEFHTTSALAMGYLIVGAVIAIVGYSLYASAKSKMAEEPLAPERTLQSLKDDKQWLTNKTNDVTR